MFFFGFLVLVIACTASFCTVFKEGFDAYFVYVDEIAYVRNEVTQRTLVL